MAAITLDRLSKTYTGAAVGMHEVSLDIADGEFLIVLGPSGCDKSTTLRMIAGIEEITSGRLFIGRREMTGVAPRDRNVAVVFQSYALYPHMTVAANIAFPLKMRRMPAAERKRRARHSAWSPAGGCCRRSTMPRNARRWPERSRWRRCRAGTGKAAAGVGASP